MLNWQAWPFGFRAATLATAAFALGMSLIPTLVYVGMAQAIQEKALVDSIIRGGGPILLMYGIALIAAVLLNPVKRSVAGAGILTTTMPAAIALMIYGLR